jgi:hypothetical protein
MQRDVRFFLESTEVNHCDDEGGYTEDALVQNTQDERANMQGGAVVYGIWKDSMEIGFAVVLHLVEKLEHLVALHTLQHVGVRPDVPVKKVDRGPKQRLLKGAEPLCLLTTLRANKALLTRRDFVIQHPSSALAPHSGKTQRRARHASRGALKKAACQRSQIAASGAHLETTETNEASGTKVA